MSNVVTVGTTTAQSHHSHHNDFRILYCHAWKHSLARLTNCRKHVSCDPSTGWTRPDCCGTFKGIRQRWLWRNNSIYEYNGSYATRSMPISENNTRDQDLIRFVRKQFTTSISLSHIPDPNSLWLGLPDPALICEHFAVNHLAFLSIYGPLAELHWLLPSWAVRVKI